jgi:hypothetical protein
MLPVLSHPSLIHISQTRNKLSMSLAMYHPRAAHHPPLPCELVMYPRARRHVTTGHVVELAFAVTLASTPLPWITDVNIGTHTHTHIERERKQRVTERLLNNYPP